MLKLFFVLVIALSAFTLQAESQAEPLKLSPGLWEGISSDDMFYQVLEINEKGPHRLVSAKLSAGFKQIEFYLFSDDQVKCSVTECIVEATNTRRPNEFVRLILTPYLDDYFTVLHIVHDETGKPILSDHYRLAQQKSQSTVRRFLDARLPQLKALQPTSADVMDGVWIGVMVSSVGDADMVLLEFSSQQTSTMTRYINGMSVSHVSSFKPEDVRKQGELWLIQGTHPIQGSNRQLVMQRNGDTFIEGYWSDSLRGHSSYAGSFRLIRLGK
ncbi:hypothetical protein [Rheinheimera sp.]|uniref:hypothetical protein n=1 Tax=Rheinheimera sp. TaxID=1869214 RepID=UPI00307D2B42